MSEGHFEAHPEVAQQLNIAWDALHNVAKHAAKAHVRKAALAALVMLHEAIRENE